MSLCPRSLFHEAVLMDYPTASSSGSPVQPNRSIRRSSGQRVLRSIKIIAIGYVIICLALVGMETRLVYPGAYLGPPPPSHENRFTPENPITGQMSTLTYQALDGSELRSRLFLRAGAERVVLFLHGNGIRAADMDDWTMRLSDTMKATVLTAEYRGFQNAGFTPSESSTIEDAVSALDALAEVTGVPQSDITLYARSLGGGVSAGLVESMQNRDMAPKSLILDRTFDSTVNVGADRYILLPIRWLMRNQYDSARRLQNFQGNVVQIHGPPDRIVPMKNGRALFEALTTPHKAWIEVPGMHHNDRITDAALSRAIGELKALENRSAPPTIPQ